MTPESQSTTTGRSIPGRRRAARVAAAASLVAALAAAGITPAFAAPAADPALLHPQSPPSLSMHAITGCYHGVSATIETPRG
ncbi:hypothetical protein, partial [Streptomyces sp. NPDC047968]|uniref:hypothetical protein n=1 Tax=Streptomyces sp. NPDC047968 TaxID=3155382 RepID=UPI0034324659